MFKLLINEKKNWIAMPGKNRKKIANPSKLSNTAKPILLNTANKQVHSHVKQELILNIEETS